MEVDVKTLPPGDYRLIHAIVNLMKCEGIFDELRRESLADVDTKPAYQNLRHRVEGFVDDYLKDTQWRSDLNKNQLRDTVRKRVSNSEMLTSGVDRIVDQAVAAKIHSVFLPKVTEIVNKFLGIEEKPATPLDTSKDMEIDSSSSSIDIDNPSTSGYSAQIASKYLDQNASSASSTPNDWKAMTGSISIADNKPVQSVVDEGTTVTKCPSPKVTFADALAENKPKDMKGESSKTASTKTDSCKSSTKSDSSDLAAGKSSRKSDTSKPAINDLATKASKKSSISSSSSSKTTSGKPDPLKSTSGNASSSKSLSSSTNKKVEVSSKNVTSNKDASKKVDVPGNRTTPNKDAIKNDDSSSANKTSSKDSSKKTSTVDKGKAGEKVQSTTSKSKDSEKSSSDSTKESKGQKSCSNTKPTSSSKPVSNSKTSVSNAKTTSSAKATSNAKPTEAAAVATEKIASKSKNETDRITEKKDTKSSDGKPKLSEDKTTKSSDGKTKFSTGSRFRSLGSKDAKNTKCSSSQQSSEKKSDGINMKNVPLEVSLKVKSAESNSKVKVTRTPATTKTTPTTTKTTPTTTKTTPTTSKTTPTTTASKTMPTTMASKTMPTTTASKTMPTTTNKVSVKVVDKTKPDKLTPSCRRSLESSKADATPTDSARAFVKSSSSTTTTTTTKPQPSVKKEMVKVEDGKVPQLSCLQRLLSEKCANVGLEDITAKVIAPSTVEESAASKLAQGAESRLPVNTKLGLPEESKLCVKRLNADIKVALPAKRSNSRIPTPELNQRDMCERPGSRQEKGTTMIAPLKKTNEVNDVGDQIIKASTVGGLPSPTVEVLPVQTKPLTTPTTTQQKVVNNPSKEAPPPIVDGDNKATVEVSDEYLTDVSVSSVHTSDLSDYDDYITLSSGSDSQREGEVANKVVATKPHWVVDVRDVNAVIEYLLKTVEEILIEEEKNLTKVDAVIETEDTSKVVVSKRPEEESDSKRVVECKGLDKVVIKDQDHPADLVVSKLSHQELGSVEVESKAAKKQTPKEEEKPGKTATSKVDSKSIESKTTVSNQYDKPSESNRRISKRHRPQAAAKESEQPEAKKAKGNSVDHICKEEEKTKRARVNSVPTIDNDVEGNVKSKKPRLQVPETTSSKQSSSLSSSESASKPDIKSLETPMKIRLFESVKRERYVVTDGRLSEAVDSQKMADNKKSSSSYIVKSEPIEEPTIEQLKPSRKSEPEMESSSDQEPGTRRGSTRQRRLNPRYASDDFSSIFNQGKAGGDMFHESSHSAVRLPDFTVASVRGRGRRSTGHSNTTDDTDPRGLSPISDVSDHFGGDFAKNAKASQAATAAARPSRKRKLCPPSEVNDSEHNADARSKNHTTTAAATITATIHSLKNTVEPQLPIKGAKASGSSSMTKHLDVRAEQVKSIPALAGVCLDPATSKRSSKPDESTQCRRGRRSSANASSTSKQHNNKVEAKLEAAAAAASMVVEATKDKPPESVEGGRGRRESMAASSTTATTISNQLCVDVNTEVNKQLSDSVGRSGRRGSAMSSLDSPPAAPSSTSTRQRNLRMESQRYDSTDLYKPRHAFAGSSRRSQRGRSPPPPPPPPPAPKEVATAVPRRRHTNPEAAEPLGKSDCGGRSHRRGSRRQSYDESPEVSTTTTTTMTTPAATFNAKRRCRV